MNISTWISAIEKNGSGEDPIIFNGKETTPRELSHEYNALTPIKGLRFTYWSVRYAKRAHRRVLRKVHGTARGMLRDRRSR